MDNIFYDCRWSNNIDNKFVDDFIRTETKVFKNNYTKTLFRKKYIDNIYGASVIEVVYINGQPEAARALWRNDIDGKEAYQPGDTCVTEACRGKGIFTEMTKRSIQMLPQNVLVYNFPNQNSYPGYMKMGWNLIGDYGFCLLTSAKQYLIEHPKKMDKKYADWWLRDIDDFFYTEYQGEYFLVRSMSKPLCYKICACVDKDIARKYARKPVGFCFYRSKKKAFYNKRLGLPLHVVSRNAEMDYIPLWKMDVI